jgi:hypothetical protein
VVPCQRGFIVIPNAFINRAKQPTDAELSAALGPAKLVWDQLLADLSRECEATIHEWKCHSPKWGWSLRAMRKKRTIIWLSPREGSFEVLFILGGKAMQVARQTKWPKRIVKVMDEAPKYPEGTGIRLEVKSSRDIGTLKKFAAIKLSN